MRHWKIWLYIVLMIATFGSCFIIDMQNRMAFPNASVPLESTVRKDTPTETASPAAQDTVVSAGEATEAPTETPVETETAVVAQVDQCVECHTNKQQLIDTAAPEQEVVEESEGAG
jgi:hypothetical protein